MKVILQKNNSDLVPGKTFKSGEKVDVSTKVGKRLIKEGKAKRVGTFRPAEVQADTEQKHKTKGE